MLPSVTVKIDWLTFTYRGLFTDLKNASLISQQHEAQQVARDVQRTFGLRGNTLTLASPMKGYQYGFEDWGTGAKIAIGSNLDEQGVAISFSGKAVDKHINLRQHALFALDDGWRCSRMDVAFDIINSEIDVDEFAGAYIDAHPMPAKRKRAYFADRGGSTLYIGSRFSSKYLRVYDKGAQQKNGLDWVRVELELKREYIHATAGQLLNDPAGCLHEIIDMLDMHSSVLTGVLLQFGSDIVPTVFKGHRPKTNREIWFMNTVIKAFEGLAADDYAAAKRVFENFQIVLADGIPEAPQSRSLPHIE